MNENDDNKNTDSISDESFEELLNQSLKKPTHFNPGEKVDVEVTQVTKEWVFIDVGSKSDGFIALNEFLDDDGNIAVTEGDRIQAYFLSSRDGELLFTTKLTVDATGTEHLEEAFRSNIPVEGFVEKEIKGGFAVRIAGNVRAFCPHSHMSLRRVEDNSAHIGQHVTFKIIEYEKKGRNIIVSHRAILEEEREKLKETLKDTLAEGMTVDGEVTSLQRFGAFVDIGGIEGLIPISEMSWGRVEDVHSLLSVGQKVTVVVKKLDWKNDKFSFSMKETQPNPWQSVSSKYPEGSLHEGKVSRLAPFGAFVTLEPGVDGLIHISELGRGKRINHPREVLEPNQAVEVKISKVDEAGKRLSLTMGGDTQESKEEDYFKSHLASGAANGSGSLGTLGDILRAKMEENKHKKK